MCVPHKFYLVILEICHALIIGPTLSQACVLACRIIDYIRVYTWDKQLESLIKSTGLLGGAGKTPTVVAPDVYKKRFELSMNKYFTLVPDFWYKQSPTHQQQQQSPSNNQQ